MVTVNVLITLGSERLYSDLARKFANRDPSESVSVIRLDKSGGCVDRSEDYMKALRHAQVREYFFGHGENTLAPSSQTCDFGELNVFQIGEGIYIYITPFSETNLRRNCYERKRLTATMCPGDNTNAYRSGDQEEYDPASIFSSTIYTRLTPSAALQNSLLAITTALSTDSQDVIRDSSVKGYIYVADVDEAKRKVRVRSPQPGGIPGNAMVLGRWPEDVPGLVG
jgi:polyribonucleotide 5'-hydroxyl-kinase